jgi:hypothetical protein
MPVTITSHDIAGLKGIVPKSKNKDYPVPGHPDLPRMYFAGLWVGGRESGKTFSCAQLLTMYAKFGIKESAPPFKNKPCRQRIIIISPTFKENTVLHDLANLDKRKDVHATYTDDLLRGIVKGIKEQQKEALEYRKQVLTWNRAVALDDAGREITELGGKGLRRLQKMNFEPPVAPEDDRLVVNFLIMDDMIGSSAYKQGRSYFTQSLLANRHIGMNVAMLVQTLRSGVPRAIRNNVSLFVLFKFADGTVTEQLYEEVSNKITEVEFKELYAYATDAPHGSLAIDFTFGGVIFKLGWDRVLFSRPKLEQ